MARKLVMARSFIVMAHCLQTFRSRDGLGPWDRRFAALLRSPGDSDATDNGHTPGGLQAVRWQC